MRMPPYLEIKCGEGHRLVMCDAENADVWDARDRAANEYRIRQGRIVVAGQYQDRPPRLGEEPGRAVENSGAQLMALERIAGQQDQVCSQRSGSGEHGPQPPNATSVVDMDIRAVHENHFRSGIRSGANVHCQLIGPVLAPRAIRTCDAQSSQIPHRGTASSSSNLAVLAVFCSETTASGLFSVWRSLAHIYHALLN